MLSILHCTPALLLMRQQRELAQQRNAGPAPLPDSDTHVFGQACIL
jgi:hypothetical protein